MIETLSGSPDWTETLMSLFVMSYRHVAAGSRMGPSIPRALTSDIAFRPVETEPSNGKRFRLRARLAHHGGSPTSSAGSLKKFCGTALGLGCYLCRGACRHDESAVIARSRPDVDDPVARCRDSHVVLDDNNRVSRLH